MPASFVSRMAGQLAGTVNVYTNGNEALGASVREALKSKKRFHIENRKVVKFEKDPAVPGDGGVLVTLEDGTVNKEGFIAHSPDTIQASDIPSQLGVEFEAQGHIKVEVPFQSTSVAGIFAAGDCATMMKAVPAATMQGAMTAAGICHQLQNEEDIEDE
jgi:gliotoxin/aspirochlorine biosynthesis thioredoxin reductase